MLKEKFSDLWHYKSGNTFINTINKKAIDWIHVKTRGDVRYAALLQYPSKVSQLNQFNSGDTPLVTMDQQTHLD
jgi:hypothetical protein